MRAIDLDFRRRALAVSWTGISLLAVALAAAGASGARYMQQEEQIAAEKARIGQVAAASSKRSRVASTGAGPVVLAPELKNASDILHQLTLPWGELFASAEASGLPDVALLSIESDNNKRRVKIAGEAKNLDSVLGYLRFLKTRPALADVYLQSHELQKQDPQQPVRFVLSADWNAHKKTSFGDTP